MLVEANLRKLGGLEIRGEEIFVLSRIALAVSAIERGVSPHVVSQFLSWREFEEEVAAILEESGASCLRGLRCSKPQKLEVDVVGLLGREVLIVDCKHWNPRSSTPSRLAAIAEQHARRARKLTLCRELIEEIEREAGGGIAHLYPIVVTLLSKMRGPLGGATIVPISLLASFLRCFDELKLELPRIAIEPAGCERC